MAKRFANTNDADLAERQLRHRDVVDITTALPFFAQTRSYLAPLSSFVTLSSRSQYAARAAAVVTVY